jgi:hypothetical protein
MPAALSTTCNLLSFNNSSGFEKISNFVSALTLLSFITGHSKKKILLCLLGFVVAFDRMKSPRALFLGTCVAGVFLFRSPSAQPIPVSYAVRLASATVYDTRAREEDTVYASLTVFVNGERKGVSIWDGKAWDGSRIEGRRWVTGLHLFGTAPVSNVSNVSNVNSVTNVSNLQVSTGRLQDTDAVQIIFEMLNASIEPSSANHESAADRIRESTCAGGDGGSAWECLAPRAASILAGWSIASCDGLVAADKLVYTAMQLRRKTETGETVTVTNIYRASDAPAACGNSIYGAAVTIARQ